MEQLSTHELPTPKKLSTKELPAYVFSTARSALFSAEYMVLNSLKAFLPGSEKYSEKMDKATAAAARIAVQDLLKRDARNITDGLYPASVLTPESPVSHVRRIPKLMADGFSIYWRRSRGQTTVFDPTARDLLSDTPRYYHRNFHFQTDGYLTRRSAELYEHQVEMLFGGTADAMRRLIIAPLKEKFGQTDGKGLTFLEIGAGTGRATRFVRLAFPKAKIVAIDLSDPYLKIAERKLAQFPRIDFMQADGGKLPFLAGQFDAVYSVFLFHELPLIARKAVLSESHRVLKPGGFSGMVDSLQGGDNTDFDGLLERFPHNYHEPFYRNYLAHPMQGLFEQVGFTGVKTDRGFFSKACWGQS